jgi:hypothetical protein
VSARARACTSLALAGLVALASPSARAHADDPASEPRIERDGRGLVFGRSAAFLLGTTPLTTVEVPDQPSLQPAWSAQGRFGFELPPGIAIALVAGGGGMASAHGAPPLFLRALVDVRYTIDLGPVRPFASVGVGFLMLKAGPNLRATFGGEATIGVDIPVASWAAIEASVGAEVLVPGDALRDAMVFAILPRVGAGFRY